MKNDNSSGLLIRRSRVRVPAGPLNDSESLAPDTSPDSVGFEGAESACFAESARNRKHNPVTARFVADQIIFGANETRWQFPDVTADRYQEAAWKARYEMARLTQTDCFALAEAVNVLTYILFDCPTTGLAVEKLRKVRAAIAARSKEPS